MRIWRSEGRCAAYDHTRHIKPGEVPPHPQSHNLRRAGPSKVCPRQQAAAAPEPAAASAPEPAATSAPEPAATSAPESAACVGFGCHTGGCPPVRMVNMRDTACVQRSVRMRATVGQRTQPTHTVRAHRCGRRAERRAEAERRGSLSRGKGAFGAQVDLRSEAKDFKDRFCVEAECVASDGGGWHLGRAVYGCEVRRLLHQVAVDLKTKRDCARARGAALLSCLDRCRAGKVREICTRHMRQSACRTYRTIHGARLICAAEIRRGS